MMNSKSRCLRERRASSRSAQAALEFLMTYGWAILVVLVAIGALAYFGVLSPDKFLPAKCTLQAGIACLDHKVDNDGAGGLGRVQIVLQNSLGFDITSVVVKAGSCGSSRAISLANGEKSPIITAPCAAALPGSKYNADLNVSYIITDTGISHNNRGQLTTRIE